MPKFRILWRRSEWGECYIEADSADKAEEKAEIGEHEKVKSTGYGGSEGWYIVNVEKAG